MRQHSDKILLILDLDETLIHSSRLPLRSGHDHQVLGYYVYKRPYLDNFLQQLSNHFHLAVWSAASPEYVEQIAKLLLPDLSGLAFLWDQAWTTVRVFPSSMNCSSSGYDDTQYVKQMSKVQNLGYTPERILLIDDMESNIRENAGNAIHISAFRGDPGDRELLRLTNFLLKIKDCEDVRTIAWHSWYTES